MIVGMKKVDEAFRELSLVDMHGATSRAIKLVQSEAKELCPVNYGELRDSIYADVEEGSREYVRGICYTNKEYAPYVEFGTGPKGQASHEGISPEIAVAYTQSPWWLHESMVDRHAAEKYHWFYVDTLRGCFYQCIGQAAQPYMYPALKNNESEIDKIYDEAIRRQI